MNLINIAVGIYLILSGLFLSLSDTLFFTSLAVVVVVPLLIARQTKGYEEAKLARKVVFKAKPGLAWLSMGVILLIPLVLGYFLYTRFNLAYNNAAFVFIGLSGWFNVVFNSIMLPLYKSETGKTFD